MTILVRHRLEFHWCPLIKTAFAATLYFRPGPGPKTLYRFAVEGFFGTGEFCVARLFSYGSLLLSIGHWMNHLHCFSELNLSWLVHGLFVSLNRQDHVNFYQKVLLWKCLAICLRWHSRLRQVFMDAEHRSVSTLMIRCQYILGLLNCHGFPCWLQLHGCPSQLGQAETDMNHC